MGSIIFQIAIRIIAGAVSEFTLIGSFVSFVFAGIPAAATIVGYLMFFPALAGVGIYEIYRIYKNRKVKKLYEGIKNPNNREYDLERELYLKAIKEFETFVNNIAKKVNMKKIIKKQSYQKLKIYYNIFLIQILMTFQKLICKHI